MNGHRVERMVSVNSPLRLNTVRHLIGEREQLCVGSGIGGRCDRSPLERVLKACEIEEELLRMSVARIQIPNFPCM